MSSNAHDHCWNMLPWYVTGRLSAGDAQRIEHHLEDCAACRAELSEQRELCAQIRRDEPVMLAPQASLQKMMARIDSGLPNGPDLDDESTHGNESTHAVVNFPTASKAKPRSYRWLAIAAAIQTVAIAFLLTLVGRQAADVMTAPRFTTLTSPDPGVPNSAMTSGAILRVVFKPETPAGQMQSLLHSVNAQVVSGPTEAGVYTLRLQRKPGEADAALAQIRSDGSVIFAEQIAVESKH
jgi:anti-sigma factor RsiW